jgi:hypothetical protein
MIVLRRESREGFIVTNGQFAIMPEEGEAFVAALPVANTALAVPKNRPGQHRWKTSVATEDLLRDLARTASDASPTSPTGVDNRDFCGVF